MTGITYSGGAKVQFLLGRAWVENSDAPPKFSAWRSEKLEIWPQRPRYFAAAIAMQYRGCQWSGVDFGPFLVDGQQGGGIHP